MSIAGAPSRFQAVLYNTESSFAEDTKTFGTRLDLTGPVDVTGLNQDKIERLFLKQRPQDGAVGIRGPLGGTFTISLYLTGLGSTAAGAISATDLYTLLVAALGLGDATSVGSTVDTPTDADTFTVAGGTWVDGQLLRIGTLGDARGNGQWHRLASETALTMELGTAAGATPNAADVVYAGLQIYPAGDPCEAVATKRFRLNSPNGQYDCHGCWLDSVTINGVEAGEVPSIDLTYGVSWWEEPDSPVTFPDATATAGQAPRVVGGGSVFIQNHGTTTRQTFNARNTSITINNVMLPINGSAGGVNEFQTVQGVRREMVQMEMEFTFDKPVAGTETFRDLWNSDSQRYHVLWSGSVVDGAALGAYLSNAIIVGPRPTQESIDELNRARLRFRGLTNTVTTTALERASFVLAMG